MFPKRVSSCKGVNPFRAPKSLPTLTSNNFVPQKGFSSCKGDIILHIYLPKSASSIFVVVVVVVVAVVAVVVVVAVVAVVAIIVVVVVVIVMIFALRQYGVDAVPM